MMLRILFLTCILASASAYAQTRPIMPPAENEPRAEQERWLANALTKYGSYKTLNLAIIVSSAKFNGCRLEFVQTRKSGATSQDVMGVTTKTATTKQDIAIDLSTLDATGVTIKDEIDPALKVLLLKLRRADANAKAREMELIVKEEAVSAIKTAFEQISRQCPPAN